MQTTVALVDDHRLFREGLRVLIDSQPHMKVVGEAANAHDAYRMVEETAPDVVVLDLMLPGVNGIFVARELLRKDPKRRLIDRKSVV